MRSFLPSPRGFCQRLLVRAGLYERVKASWAYDFYWRMADPRIVENKRMEFEFYRNVLDGFRKGDLIFDIGANDGCKAETFLRLGARVIAVEPDETNCDTLRHRYLEYRLKRKAVCIVAKAVSDRKSVEKMWIDTPGSALNTLSLKWTEALKAGNGQFGSQITFGRWKEVETTTLADLIGTYGLPFFVKIDVEGFELNVLRGMRRPVPYLSFEVNLPEFRREGLECIQILRALDPEGRFNFVHGCQRGLLSNQWLGAADFSTLLTSSNESAVEVFWKTSMRCA